MPNFIAATAPRPLRIYYEQYGARANPTLLLIHGLSCQLIHWPESLIRSLVDAGFRVVAFDNRDVGRSETLSEYSVPGATEVMADPGSYKAVYQLSDMADDAMALINHVGQSGAHVVGLSMGGMIAQRLAIAHPDRIFSLTSIMSSTGAPDLPAAQPDVAAAFLTTPPDDRAQAIAHLQRAWRAMGGSHFDSSECGLGRFSELAVDRGFDRNGFTRQLLAILHDGDRTSALRQVTIPSLVIHGGADGLVPPAAGEATAKALPHSKLVTIPNMGHDLPEPLLDEIAQAVIGHLRSVPAVR